MNRAAPQPLDNMGRPEPRIDGRLKVTGEARYGSDFPVEDPAYGYLITSAIAKGRIARIDTRVAKMLPGVLEIFTYENTGDLKDVEFASGGGGGTTSMQGFGPEIFHDGQILGMAVADTLETAREAAMRVVITYEAQKPSATFGSDGITDENASDATPKAKDLPQAGNFDEAIRSAEVVLDVAYGTATQHHNPIELFTTTCAWRDGQLTVYEPSQFVYGLKNSLAKKLGIAPERVHVVSPFIGGAFGSKAQLSPRTGLVALAAKKLNRPVKLAATRDQGFTIQTYRAETRHMIRFGAQRDGKITAFSHEGLEVTSRPDPYVVAGVDDSARLYHYGAVKTHVTLVHADRNTPGFMRSPPVVPYIFALECAMDELSDKLAMDPIELRRKNDSMTDSMGKAWSSRSLMRCYDEGAQAFGWSKRDPRPGSMRDGDWLIGWGCASAIYPTHLCTATARVRLMPDGHALVQIAAQDIGTGAYTAIGQVAAEQLGVPLGKVSVELGDTDLPPGPVAGGSVTTASAGTAVMKACDGLRDKLVRAATAAKDGPLAGKPHDAVRLQNGKLVADDGASEALAAVFDRLGAGVLEEYAEYVPPGNKPETIRKLYQGQPTLSGGTSGEKLMYAVGAEFVEVRVHAETREIRVPRMLGVFAGGHIVNPRTARSQLLGGMIWGISTALLEETEIDPRNARYVNDNLADYTIPVCADIRDVDVRFVPERDEHVNPLGIKGLGELGNVGTAPAAVNAVWHATGIRVRQLPVRLAKLIT